MLAIFLVATLAGTPTARAQALHAELLTPVQRCLVGSEVAEACLSAARKRCIARLNNGSSVDPLIESFCAAVENEGLEATRLDVEAKLTTALSKWKEADVLASVRAGRKAWETYRGRWCDDEGRTAPTALTGQADLAREACRKGLTLDRLVRVRRMIEWLTP